MVVPMKSKRIRCILSLGVAAALSGCAHAYLKKKTETGAEIGHGKPGFFTSRADIKKDFDEVANKACNGKTWKPVQIYLPVPTGSSGSGGAVSRGIAAYAEDRDNRDDVLFFDVPITYGNYFGQSTTSVDIECQGKKGKKTK